MVRGISFAFNSGRGGNEIMCKISILDAKFWQFLKNTVCLDFVKILFENIF